MSGFQWVISPLSLPCLQQLASHEWPVHEILPLKGFELETARSQAEALSTRPRGHVNSIAFSRYNQWQTGVRADEPRWPARAQLAVVKTI